MSYTLIERKELASDASSISFNNIPQFYSDLVVVLSTRGSTTDGNVRLSINGSTANLTERELEGNGSSASSASRAFIPILSNLSNATVNTFANASIYIPNYTSSNNKSITSDAVTENNGTTAYQTILAGLWSNSDAINSLGFSPPSGNLVAGSSISLYGINRQQAIGKPKAIGGAITFANGYWYHTFTGSGTFNSLENLSVDAVVVAGGGGGNNGGGGAGGFLSFASQSLVPNIYLVTVGAGGTAGAGGGGAAPGLGVAGNSSQFASLTATVGGGGGDAGSGGSGAGGAAGFNSNNGGIATSGQGQNGGSASGDSANGGGGGASQAGSNATTGIGGKGGNGSALFSSWGLVTSTGENVSGTVYYAGGGGGGGSSNNPGAGGFGGGGRGNNGTNTIAGSPNTGGGGGGKWGGSPAAGGSGIVIIRYPAS
jgi:hypothetical protein